MAKAKSSGRKKAGKPHAEPGVGNPTEVAEAIALRPALPLIRWSAIATVVAALAEDVMGDVEVAAPKLAQLANRLTAPHRILARLHELTEPVLAGHGAAALELRRRLKEIVEALPETAETAQRILQEHVGQCGCGCGETSRIDPQAERPPEESAGTIDDGALVRLAGRMRSSIRPGCPPTPWARPVTRGRTPSPTDSGRPARPEWSLAT